VTFTSPVSSGFFHSPTIYTIRETKSNVKEKEKENEKEEERRRRTLSAESDGVKHALEWRLKTIRDETTPVNTPPQIQG